MNTSFRDPIATPLPHRAKVHHIRRAPWRRRAPPPRPRRHGPLSPRARTGLRVDQSTLDWIQAMDPMDEAAVAYYLTRANPRVAYLTCLRTAHCLIADARIITQLGRIARSLRGVGGPLF